MVPRLVPAAGTPPAVTARVLPRVLAVAPLELRQLAGAVHQAVVS